VSEEGRRGAGDAIARVDARVCGDAGEAAQGGVDAIQAQIDGIDIERESLQDQLSLAEEAVRLAELDIQRLRDAIQEGADNPAEIERRLQQLTVTKRDAPRIREQPRLLPTRQATLQAQLAEQTATLRTARLNVERATIRAPFAGVLQSVDIDAGERVGRGQVVARLVDLSNIEIPVRLPSSAVTDISVGSSVLLLDERPDGVRSWVGTIARLAPEVDPTTRTLTAFVEIRQDSAPDPENISPGMFLRAVVESNATQPRLVIPRASVSDDRVWVVEDTGTLAYRTARPTFAIDDTFEQFDPVETDWVAIDPNDRGTPEIPPLRAGERVVLNPSESLRPGSTVRTEDELAATPTLVSTPQASADAESDR